MDACLARPPLYCCAPSIHSLRRAAIRQVLSCAIPAKQFFSACIDSPADCRVTLSAPPRPLHCSNALGSRLETNSTNSLLPELTTNNGEESANGTPNGTKQRRKKKSKNDHRVEADSAFHGPDLDMIASPEASTKKKSKAKQPRLPSEAHQEAPMREPTPEHVQPIRGKCLRCREKGIKCNEGKPSCNQCLRGLWTCQYEMPCPKKRSKSGCLNCGSQKRKCTEERPSCAYCLKVDDACVYGEYA